MRSWKSTSKIRKKPFLSFKYFCSRRKTRTKGRNRATACRREKEKEEETEQEEEDSEDKMVSNGAYVVMKEILMHKDFVRERGFLKLIAPFREVIEKKGWNFLCEH